MWRSSKRRWRPLQAAGISVSGTNQTCLLFCRYSKGDVAELRAEVEALKAGMGKGVGNGKPAAGHAEAMVV